MSNTRKDGRSSNQTRPVTITYDGLARADGSARFGFSPSTLSLSTTSGPIEVRLLSEQPSTATFDIHIRPLTSVSSTEQKALSATFKQALEPALLLSTIPRSLVQVVVQSLDVPRAIVGKLLNSENGQDYHDGGRRGRGPKVVWKEGMVASMLNSATLSLINSGSIPMRGVVCAVSVAKLKISGSSGNGNSAKAEEAQYVLVVDPDEEEEVGRVVAGGTFAFMFAHGLGSESKASSKIGGGNGKEREEGCECVWTNWRSFPADGSNGMADILDLAEANQLAKTAARGVWEVMKQSIDPEKRRGSVPRQTMSLNREENEDEDDEMENPGQEGEADDRMEIA